MPLECPCELVLFGVIGGEKDGGVGAHWFDQGVLISGLGAATGFWVLMASEAAFRSKFVVPRAFVEPERAEHTIATL